MTEEEARKKWCPFGGSVVEGIVQNSYCCFASDCMMWRWHTEAVDFRKAGDDLYVPAHYRQGGYCGLGGKP